jgi:hypothetical protein
MRTIIWTKAAYELLYEQLVAKFGPHKSWATQSPEGYKKFCKTFAELVGANSGDAVSHQIQYAIGGPAENSSHTWYQSHFRNVIRNKAAAFDAGFIDNSYFPRHVVAYGKGSAED